MIISIELKSKLEIFVEIFQTIKKWNSSVQIVFQSDGNANKNKYNQKDMVINADL